MTLLAQSTPASRALLFAPLDHFLSGVTRQRQMAAAHSSVIAISTSNNC